MPMTSVVVSDISYFDIVFFCKSQEELRQMLAIFDSEFRRFGLIISHKKTKTMVFNVPDSTIIPASLVKLNDKPIENVSKFLYVLFLLCSA